MNTVPLGRTGLSVSKLGLGALFVKSENASLDDAKRAVARAVERGVSYLDTAPGYGDSEEVLGKCLAEIPDADKLVVSTKIGGPEPFDPRDPAKIVASVETSLRRLGRERVDLLYVHEPDRPRQNDWWTDYAKVEGPVLDAVAGLRDRGLIGHVGLGGTTTTDMAHLVRSGHFDVLLTAFQFNALLREAEDELLPAAREQGMGVVLGSALHQGLLTGEKPRLVEEAWWLARERKAQLRDLWALCRGCGIGVAELAMRFAVFSDAGDVVLMGPKNAEEVDLNLAALEAGPLPADVLAELDTLAARLPHRPYGEPVGLGWYANDPSGYAGLGHPWP